MGTGSIACADVGGGLVNSSKQRVNPGNNISKDYLGGSVEVLLTSYLVISNIAPGLLYNGGNKMRWLKEGSLEF